MKRHKRNYDYDYTYNQARDVINPPTVNFGDKTVGAIKNGFRLKLSEYVTIPGFYGRYIIHKCGDVRFFDGNSVQVNNPSRNKNSCFTKRNGIYRNEDGYFSITLYYDYNASATSEYRVRDLLELTFGSDFEKDYLRKDIDYCDWFKMVGFDEDYLISSNGMIRSFKHKLPQYVDLRGMANKNKLGLSYPMPINAYNDSIVLRRYKTDLLKVYAKQENLVVKASADESKYDSLLKWEKRVFDEDFEDEFEKMVKYYKENVTSKTDIGNIQVTEGTEKQIAWAKNIVTAVVRVIKKESPADIAFNRDKLTMKFFETNEMFKTADAWISSFKNILTKDMNAVWRLHNGKNDSVNDKC